MRLGEFDVGSISETLPYQEQDVGSVVLHPGFDNRSLAHDIALLHLASPAQHKPNVDIVCLPRRDQDSASGFRRCVITGWGRRNEGRLSSKLIQFLTGSYEVCNLRNADVAQVAYLVYLKGLCIGKLLRLLVKQVA